MDLESELRKAMEEQVAEAAAPPTLVSDVRRRYRRRQTRIRVGVGVAAAAVAVAVVAPGYQSFRAGTVGANGDHDGRGGSPAPSTLGRATPPGLPEAPVAPGQPAPGTAPSRAPGTGEPGRPGSKPPGAAGVVRLPKWVTFLPSGLVPEAPCGTSSEGRATVTTCGWRGSDGSSVEIRLVRGPDVGSPEDLIRSPGVPKPTKVRGVHALTIEHPGEGVQIVWLDRPGVGVIVTADGPARSHLMRIAEGVRP
ncbi:hypothetical protein Acsp03_50480 [Actinomadura sp. NBRC 104412]|uniref:hypothetical protein n=1 Tax=Actinomadura sp. NBRC 104412 TaxID=3032203 RepID=UPI0024A5CC52|nr:hypothetical protein [Actinomadura sp. NBRC 104412]GLZ07582.1 hypothetical protein Acsp03_50480 [Actinomadura sp. NBRC 104412]